MPSALVALLGLGSRLLPHVLEVGGLAGQRPAAALPARLLERQRGDGSASPWRCCSGRAAARPGRPCAGSRWRRSPPSLLALYFTYSRGGLLALLVAAGCLIALSRDRLWLLATLAIGALGALPAVLAVQARRSLADNVANQAAVDQGVTVLLILLAGIALSLLLFAGAAPASRVATGG